MSGNDSLNVQNVPLQDARKKALIQEAYVRRNVTEKEMSNDAFSPIIYPEKSVEKRKNDAETIKLHEDVKVAFRKHAEVLERIKKQYTCNQKGLDRLSHYLMNPEETTAAREENERLFRSLQTPAGAQAMVNRLVKECLETDVTELIPTNMKDMAAKYIADPMKYDRFWAICDLLSYHGQGNYKIEEPALSALREKQTIVQNAAAFSTAAEIMADDNWAFLAEESITAEQWTQIGTECVLSASSKRYTEDEKHFYADLGQKAVRWGDAIKSREALLKMKEKGMLGDDVSLTWNNKNYPRSQIVEGLSSGEIASVDTVTVTHLPEDQKAILSEQIKNLPTNATEIARQQAKSIKEAELRAKYQAMLDHHAPSFADAKIPLPSAEEVKKNAEDPVAKAAHERAKAEAGVYDTKRKKLEEQFPASPSMPAPFRRLYRFLLDTSGTSEALEHNRQLQAVSGTLQGQQAMLDQSVKMLMEKPDDFFIPRDMADAAMRYCDDPAVFQMGWVAENVLSAMNEPGMVIDPDIKEAFEAKKSIFESGVVFENAATFMARDDWAVFDSTQMSPKQFGLLLASRTKRDISANDPYRVIPFTTEELSQAGTRLLNDELKEVYAVRFSDSGILPMITTGKKLLNEGSPLFKAGTEVKIGGKSVSTDKAILHLYHNKPERVEITAKPEMEKAVKNKVSLLSGDIMEIVAEKSDALLQRSENTVATMGKLLRQDMKNLYQQLDGVNHGLFISSNEFNQVIRTAKKLSEGVYSGDQANEAFEKIIKYGEQYISNKAGKTKFSAREQGRLDAIKAAVNTARERKEVLERQHAHAEGVHENFQREFAISDKNMKTDRQLHMEEITRAASKGVKNFPEAEAMRLSMKYSVENLHNAEGYHPVPPLSREEIEKRIRDPKLMQLHERALSLQNHLKEASEENNKKYSVGTANADINRISSYFMDYSGTPEAEEHNRLIGAAISTPEGCKALMSRMAHMLLTDPAVHEAMTATTLEEAITAYEKNPMLCDMAFNAGNISSLTRNLDEPLKTAYRDQIAALEGAKFCQTAVAYAASDIFFAYGDIKLEPESIPYLNDLGQTVLELHPEEASLSSAIQALGNPTDPQMAMKQLLANGLLRIENEFSDKNGKHLSTEAAAEKMANNAFSMEGIECKKRVNHEKLHAQIQQMDVAEPLQYGRKVMDGQLAGSLGHVTDSHFNERIDDIIRIFDNLSQFYPGCYDPKLDEATDYLRSFKIGDGETMSPAQAQEKFHQIGTKMNQWHEETMDPPEADNKSMDGFLRNLCSAFNNADSLAQTCERKAASLQAHRDFEKSNGVFERSNGAHRFVSTHILGENVPKLPDELKNIMKDFVEVSEQNYGQKLGELSEANQNKFTYGMAGSLLVNQLELEQKQYHGGDIGPVSKLLQQGTKVSALCDAMKQNEDFRALCGDVLKNPKKMNALLNNPKEMAAALNTCINGKNKKAVRAENAAVKAPAVKPEEKAKEKSLSEGGYRKNLQ